MLEQMSNFRCAAALAVAFTSSLAAQSQSPYNAVNPWWQAGQGTVVPRLLDWENPSGQLRIQNQLGDVTTADHPFFNALGTNGRACATCHQPANAMSVGTALLQ